MWAGCPPVIPTKIAKALENTPRQTEKSVTVPSGLKQQLTRNRGIEVAPPVQHHKVWLTPNTGVPCSNAAKMQNPLKFAGVPQTNAPISAASRPKLTILWEHVEEILLLNKFFPIVDTCFSCSCEDIARQSCAMVPRWRFLATFLRPVFPASRAQHVSDLHSKFTLGPHPVPKYGRHPISDC